MKTCKATLGVVFLIIGITAWGQVPSLEDMRYEDRFTFKHGKSYVLDPFVWGYTKEFAERFRMPQQWIEPELKGALAVAFRMTTIGITQCGLGGRAENCWQPLNCQMDIYYDSSIQLPWNYPQIERDTSLQGLASVQFLHFTPESRIRKYVSKDPNKPSGIMNVGGGLVYGRFSQGGAKIIYYDREYEPGVAVIGYRGMGVCPKYAGPEQVSMPFESNEDFQKYRRGLLAEKDIRTVHRIEFPQSFLARARAVYAEGNKPNEQTTERLIRQFFASRGAVANGVAKQ